MCGREKNPPAIYPACNKCVTQIPFNSGKTIIDQSYDRSADVSRGREMIGQ